MKPQSSRRFAVRFVVLAAILISSACSTSTESVPAGEQALSTPESLVMDIEYGPGPFDYVDTRAGLAGLSSYTATLNMTFEGTRDGQAEEWSRSYVMQSTAEPAALQLTIEKAGDQTNLDPVFLAEADGVDYESSSEKGCLATVIEEGYSLRDRLELAGFLSAVIGADEAGSETVSDTPTNHYTFDQRALGQQDRTESTGEMWIASDGGYVVKYLLTTKADADFFGEGVEGTLTLDYELTGVDQPTALELPAECPAGIVSAPLLPDASEVSSMPGVLSFNTSSPLPDASVFYQEQLPPLGWVLVGEPVIDETSAYLQYEQGDEILSVIATSEEGATTVNLLLEKAQAATTN